MKYLFWCLGMILLMTVSGEVVAKTKKTQKTQRTQPAQSMQKAPIAKSETIRVPAQSGSSRNEGDYVTEKRSDGTIVKYKKKNTYDFEGTDIEGLFNRPSGAYISDVKGVKGRSIIRVRKNFDAEVIDSSRWVK